MCRCSVWLPTVVWLPTSTTSETTSGKPVSALRAPCAARAAPHSSFQLCFYLNFTKMLLVQSNIDWVTQRGGFYK